MPDQSILNSVKKNLGITADYTAFDPDIILYINGVFSQLNQLGIGLVQGFQIEDNTAVWATFMGTGAKYNWVKNYMVLKVRLLFDPPTNSFTISAIQDQIRELEWRMNMFREETAWVAPDPHPEYEPVLDGGGV